MTPLLPRRFTVTSIGPPPAGGTTQGVDGSFATVQPQEVRTLLMDTSADVMFVRTKVNLASLSPLLLVYSFFSESNFSAVNWVGTCGVTAGKPEGGTRGGATWICWTGWGGGASGVGRVAGADTEGAGVCAKIDR